METSQLPDNPPGLLFIVPELADSSDEQHGSIIQVKEEPIEETTVEPMEHSHVAVQDEGTESHSNLTVKEESLDDTSVNIDDQVKDECLDDTPAEETSGGQYGNHGNIQSMDEGNHHGSSLDQVSIKEESGDECHQAEFANSYLDGRTSELQNNQSADIEAGYLKLEEDESEALEPSPGTSSTGQTGNAASLTFDSYGNLVHRPESSTDGILRRNYKHTEHKLFGTEPSSNTTGIIQSSSESIPFVPAVDAVKLFNAKYDTWSAENYDDTGHMFQDGEVQLKSELNLYDHQNHEDHLSNQQEEKYLLPTDSETGYVCPECKKCFSHIENLEVHMMTHTTQQSYECALCGKVFSHSYNLKSHMRHFHRNKKPHKCSECGMSFRSNSDLINHMISHDSDFFNQMITNKEKHMSVHSGKKAYGCVLCKKKFSCQPSLKNHMKQHQCMVCGKMTYNMVRHMKTHTNDKPHKCAKCGECFQFSGELNSHMKTQHEGIHHICKVCRKNFRCAKYLKEHMVVHSGGTAYTCEKCGKLYASKASLDRHINDHLPIKPHICAVCGKGFGIQANLKKHMKIHTDGKTYICKICGKDLHHPEYLREHMAMHSGQELPKCERCGKKCSTSYTLANHMTLHNYRDAGHQMLQDTKVALKSDLNMLEQQSHNEGLPTPQQEEENPSLTHSEKPCESPECQKCFAHPKILESHMITHSGGQTTVANNVQSKENPPDTDAHMITHPAEKFQQCNVCWKYVKKTSLNIHMYEHLTAKLFICEECGKGYGGPSGLKKHMRNYMCNVCGKHLCNVKSLKQHMIEHSGENAQECEPILARNFLA